MDNSNLYPDISIFRIKYTAKAEPEHFYLSWLGFKLFLKLSALRTVLRFTAKLREIALKDMPNRYNSVILGANF